jgi:cellulose synthase operon protein C
VVAFEAGRYSQCLEQSQGNPDLAEIRGWCLIELNRPTEAERAFATAISAGVGDAADLDLGLALSYLSRGMAQDAERVLQRGNLSASKREEVRAEILARRATSAYDAQDYRTAIALIDERSRVAPARRDLLMLKGWALHNLNRRTEALELFMALDRQMSSTETQNAMRIVRSAMQN